MKQLVRFILGFIVGVIIIFVIYYAIGYALQFFDIQLYSSEAEQQRNFNIYFILSVVGGVVSGYFFTKRSVQ